MNEEQYKRKMANIDNEYFNRLKENKKRFDEAAATITAAWFKARKDLDKDFENNKETQFE